MGLLNKFRAGEKKKGVEQEVIDNLAAILNTKQNYGAWQKGFGLKSYANINSSTGAIESVIAEIEKNVSQFEKRIQLIRIIHVESGNPLYLKFQISCKIGGKMHSFYIGFTHHPKPILVEEEKHG